MRNRAVHAFGVSCVRAAQGEPACRPRRNPSTTPSETSQLTALGLANRSMQRESVSWAIPQKRYFVRTCPQIWNAVDVRFKG
jgi:hypothetical protein